MVVTEGEAAPRREELRCRPIINREAEVLTPSMPSAVIEVQG